MYNKLMDKQAILKRVTKRLNAISGSKHSVEFCKDNFVEVINSRYVGDIYEAFDSMEDKELDKYISDLLDI